LISLKDTTKGEVILNPPENCLRKNNLY